MSRTRTVFEGAITILGVFLSSTRGGTEEKTELVRLREGIVEARSPKELRDNYQRFFHYVGAEGLQEWKHDRHVGLSLQVAWQLTLGNDKENPEKILGGFLGFVEGKTNLGIPEFWENEIKGVLLTNKRDLSREPLQKSYTSVGKWHQTGLDLRTPIDTSVRAEHETLRISRGDKVVKIEADEFKKITHGFPKLQHLIVDFAKDEALILMYPRGDYPFPLACLNAKSGKVNWKAEVWGQSGRTWRTRLGSWNYEVDLVKSKDTVGIFGENAGQCYLEIFDLKNGANLCRFATNY